MGFARQAGAAVILVTLTLWLQCAGMAVLIDLARTYIARSTKGLSAWRAAVLIVGFPGSRSFCTFCRFSCGQHFIAGIVFQPGRLASISPVQLFHCRLWRRRSPAGLAGFGSGRKYYRRIDVWHVSKCPIRDRNETGRSGDQIFSRGWNLNPRNLTSEIARNGLSRSLSKVVLPGDLIL